MKMSADWVAKVRDTKMAPDKDHIPLNDQARFYAGKHAVPEHEKMLVKLIGCASSMK